MFVVAGSRSDPPAQAALDSEEQLFLTLINQYRQDNGAGALVGTTTLENAAVWMSGDMGANAYFSHTDSTGRDPWTRLCDFQYCFNTWKGENLVAGASGAQQAFDLWKDSPGHNANMLNANYNVIGIGRVYTAGSPYGWYWTTDFGGYIPAAPTPSGTASPPPATATPTPAPTATPSPAPTPTQAPTPSPAPTASPTPSPPPAPTPTPFNPTDVDNDGFTNAVEIAIATNFSQNCGNFDTSKPGSPSRNWPADLASETTSADRVDMSDIGSFLAPVRRVNTSPGDAGYDVRWDLVPGAGIFDHVVNLQDIISLVTLKPAMFGGASAFNGPSCD